MRTESRRERRDAGDEGDTGLQDPGRVRSARRSGFVFCLKAFVGVRVLLTVLGLIAVGVLPHVPPGGLDAGGVGHIPGPIGVPGWAAHQITSGWHNVFLVWERFDALWFLRIAADGYRAADGSLAFFPLFPLLTRWVGAAAGGHPLAGGLIVSNAAAFGATVALYELTRTELSEGSARRTVLLFTFFPTAFFLVAPYSESLFVLLAVLAMLAARRRRWWAAGVAGALAALTRNLGVVLVIPLAVEAGHQAWERRPRRFDPAALWALAPVVGLGVYLWFGQRLSGDWLAPVHQQAGWQRELAAPWWTLGEATTDAHRFLGIYPGGYHALDWVVAVPVLIGAVACVRWFRPSFTAYAWAMLLPPLLFVFTSRPLMSFPRFALVAFPVFWAFERMTEKRGRFDLALGASAALMGVLFVLFANWYYVF